MEKARYEFEAIENLQLENSFTVLKKEENIVLNCTVGINDETYGWFEVYDKKTEGNEWYAEGGIWFKNKVVTDYDGVFALPRCIVSKLEELGFNCEEVK